MDSIEKGRLGESFVNQIAFRSFLKYWCYPAPLDIVKDNKEICDLLIVFKDVCFIISVKNYSFKGDYQQYFKKTTDKAIRQIKGAERTLFRNDVPVLLKHPDRDAEVFQSEIVKETYRIVINISTDVKYYQTSFYLNEQSYTVMDAAAWFAALEELNSVPDFTNYISKRCKLFGKYPAFIMPREEYDISDNDKLNIQHDVTDSMKIYNGVTIISGSELDLIAIYFEQGYKFSDDLQKSDDVQSHVLKIDGRWEAFQNSKITEIKEDYEKESYFIDELVREFLIAQKDGHHLAAMFFQLDRLDRAAFARTFLEYHGNVGTGTKLNRTHVVFPFMHMVFIYFEDGYPTEELQSFLEISLHHHHYLFNSACKQVGALGMSKSTNEFLFGYAEIDEPYTAEEIEKMKIQFSKLGWKTDHVNTEDIEFKDEY
ncbi:MAG: hypothetical protein R2800_09520 [Flavipsychrobacter sp.]